MAILAGVGFSRNQNPVGAVEESYQKSISSLQGNTPSMILLFASSQTYDQQQVLQALSEKNSTTKVIGCSSAGEITSLGPLDNSLVLLSLYSDQVKFVPGLGHNIKQGAKEAGKSFAQDILARSGGEKPKAAIIFPDGLSGDGAALVKGVLEVFGNEFMLVGGSSGDDYLFKQTFQYFGDQVLSGCLVGVGLYGKFALGVSVRHGWIPIGTPRIATKAVGNKLYELDNKPAVQIYEDHFGKDRAIVDKNEPFARIVLTYPLGIPSPNKDGYLIRGPLMVDESGAITLAAEVPRGSEVSMMIGSPEEAIDATVDAVRAALSQVDGRKPKAVLVFDDIARKKLLMEKRRQEIERIKAFFDPEVPLAGFYCYGEQAPLVGGNSISIFHSQTCVVLVLAE